MWSGLNGPVNFKSTPVYPLIYVLIFFLDRTPEEREDVLF